MGGGGSGSSGRDSRGTNGKHRDDECILRGFGLEGGEVVGGNGEVFLQRSNPFQGLLDVGGGGRVGGGLDFQDLDLGLGLIEGGEEQFLVCDQGAPLCRDLSDQLKDRDNVLAKLVVFGGDGGIHPNLHEP